MTTQLFRECLNVLDKLNRRRCNEIDVSNRTDQFVISVCQEVEPIDRCLESHLFIGKNKNLKFLVSLYEDEWNKFFYIVPKYAMKKNKRNPYIDRNLKIKSVSRLYSFIQELSWINLYLLDKYNQELIDGLVDIQIDLL